MKEYVVEVNAYYIDAYETEMLKEIIGKHTIVTFEEYFTLLNTIIDFGYSYHIFNRGTTIEIE